MGKTLYARAGGWRVAPNDPFVTAAPVHVWRPARGALCGAEVPSNAWFIGVAKLKWNEEPCPDCVAVLAAEAAVGWACADDILAEWG